MVMIDPKMKSVKLWPVLRGLALMDLGSFFRRVRWCWIINLGLPCRSFETWSIEEWSTTWMSDWTKRQNMLRTDGLEEIGWWQTLGALIHLSAHRSPLVHSWKGSPGSPVHPKDFLIFQAPMHPFIALITHRSPTFIFTPKSCRKTLHHALKASACQYFACCFSAAMKSPLRPSRAARTSSLARSTSSTSTAATAPGCCSAGSAGLAASLRRSRSSMARAVEGLEAS